MRDPNSALRIAAKHHRNGRLALAETALRRLLAVAAVASQAHQRLVLVLLDGGREEEAEELARQAIVQAPDDPGGHDVLGQTLAAQGRWLDAGQAFATALALAPANLEIAHRLARAWMAARHYDQAQAVLEEILSHDSACAKALSALGILHLARRQHEWAEDAFRRALSVAPDHVVAARALATLYQTDGRRDDAQALAPAIADPLAGFALATTVPAILDAADQADAALAAYAQALARPPALTVADPVAAFPALGHFYCAYYDRPLRGLHEAAARTYRRLCPDLVYTAATAERRRPQRARPRLVAVSDHFHDHTIHRLFAALLVGLVPWFEVVAAAAPGPEDAARRALARGLPLVRLSPRWAEARRQLAELDADVLFYPDIGMGPFTYFLAHARLAPLQLVGFGHPVTPGLDSVDAFLSSAVMSPAGAEADHSEALIRLPAPAFCFPRPGIAAAGRDRFDLPAAARLYLCPQSPFKLHPDFDAVLAAILRRDPAGVVVLLGGGVPAWAAALERRFRRTMPDVVHRLRLLPPLPRSDFLGLLAAGDVMLDIPSFSGGNTTLEALAAGLPVVTRPGEQARGRLTLALLELAGLSAGIAASEADYVERAVAIAADGRAYRAAIAAQADSLFLRHQAAADMAQAIQPLLERD